MSPNKMARAHVATLGAITGRAAGSPRGPPFILSFHLIENILEPLKCIINFG